jgi:adenylate cyclase
MEIERKFLISHLPENLETCQRQEILQWYFKVGKKSIRVRKIIEYKKQKEYASYTITKKKWNGLIRKEEEKKISEKEFLEYRELAQHNKIKKTRFLYPYKKNIIEIDQFHDTLDGLRMAEVEFDSEQEAIQILGPDRCTKEVTEIKEASNSYLSIFGMKKLIRKTWFQNKVTHFQLKSFYNQEAIKYSQTRKKHRNDFSILAEAIKNHPKENITIVELWCGSGRFLEHLWEISDKKISYLGIDISENLLNEAKKIQVPKNIKVKFICQDMLYYISECEQESVDIFVWIASFQHLITKRDRFLAAKYMYRWLSYEGLVLMSNRSFSSRMIKKHRLTLLKSIVKKIFYPNKNERNNLMIPWKSEHLTYKRFYHLFTKDELKNIFNHSGFIIKNLSYLSKSWTPIENRKQAKNTLLIAEKNVTSDQVPT